jgi:bifunctional DNase/RNase
VELGVRIRRVTVCDLTDDTYRARILLEQDGTEYDVDARPSDAIAIALRADAPIFVADAVLDRVGMLPGAEQERRLSMFREFVNSLELDLGGGASDRDG